MCIRDSPCIDCNRYLKFDHLLNRARELGCDYIATGHYVQRWQDENGRWGLRKHDDPGKEMCLRDRPMRSGVEKIVKIQNK